MQTKQKLEIDINCIQNLRFTWSLFSISDEKQSSKHKKYHVDISSGNMQFFSTLFISKALTIALYHFKLLFSFLFFNRLLFIIYKSILQRFSGKPLLIVIYVFFLCLTYAIYYFSLIYLMCIFFL